MKSGSQTILRELVIEHLKERYSRQYSEIIVNKDTAPDIVLSNHGLKIAGIFVETDESLTKQKAEIWKSCLNDGIRIIVVVPSKSKTKITSILWDLGLMTDISVGTYDLTINTPV